MTTVQPIDNVARERVLVATTDWVEQAAVLYRRQIAMPAVQFDLIGRAAGMYRVDCRGRVIRYNPYLFAKYFDENLAVTVPHEVAHHVVHMLHGSCRVCPHGPEWRSVMQAFGVDAACRTEFDMTGIPQRRQRRFNYRCRCRDHSLSARAHNRRGGGGVAYLCRFCGEPLEPVPRDHTECLGN